VCDGVDHLAVEAVEPRYYNDTTNTARQSAMDRQAANGGLGEYYSEADTRIPTWLIVGDQVAVAGLCGPDSGVAGSWLDDGVAPNGQVGRAFTEASVHGVRSDLRRTRGESANTTAARDSLRRPPSSA
jgi:hypothetical protein